MEIEDKIYDSLINDPAIQALVGKKIYYLQAPPREDAPVPLIVYSAAMRTSGDLNGLNNLENGTVEISINTADRPGLLKLRRLVMNAIDKALLPTSCSRDGGGFEPTERIYVETINFSVQHNTNQ